jgi:hypothetical protein
MSELLRFLKVCLPCPRRNSTRPERIGASPPVCEIVMTQVVCIVAAKKSLCVSELLAVAGLESSLLVAQAAIRPVNMDIVVICCV